MSQITVPLRAPGNAGQKIITDDYGPITFDGQGNALVTIDSSKYTALVATGWVRESYRAAAMEATISGDEGTTDTAQTITSLKSFASLMLAVWNGGLTFVTKFTSLATANRTFTLPDVDMTPAQAAVATAGTAPAFTGTAPVGLVNPTPIFSGTGLTAVGQVLTSSDNQTMTLNQCAGMLLVSHTGNVVIIASNTAVVGAPAVLTVVGKATTDAGVYSIFSGLAPVGTVANHTHVQT